MTSPVVTIGSQSTLRQAAAALTDADVGTLVVLRGDETVGIVSERDVARALAYGADPDEVWVGDVMTENPRYLACGEPIDDAVRVMLGVGIRHLPVYEEGVLVGIVSIRDLLGHT